MCVCVHVCVRVCVCVCAFVLGVYVMMCYDVVIIIHHHSLCRRGTVKLKPLMIVDYNKHMLGVDKLDQLMSYYSFLHKSVKWWRKVFWILEVAVINAYIIYKELALKQGDKPLSHTAFRRQLIASPSKPIRSSVTTRARPGPQASANVECLRPVPHFPQKSTKRRDCIVCTNRKEVPDI